MAARGVLALLSILLAWTATEIGARLLLGPPPAPKDRVLLLSEPNWVADAFGAVRYAPNAEIRVVALDRRNIGYDVSFATNNLGFVDTRDYLRVSDEESRRSIALVGDSFTAGFHAGNPWVAALRKRARLRDPTLELYNLGIGGTGLPLFRDLIAGVEQQLEIDQIAILFITDDLYRISW